MKCWRGLGSSLLLCTHPHQPRGQQYLAVPGTTWTNSLHLKPSSVHFPIIPSLCVMSYLNVTAGAKREEAAHKLHVLFI